MTELRGWQPWRCTVSASILGGDPAAYRHFLRTHGSVSWCGGGTGLDQHSSVLRPPSTAALLATYCVLGITSDAQVLNAWGEPIKGLYSAGDVNGAFHGAAYTTGSSLGKAAAFGRIAGRHCATSHS